MIKAVLENYKKRGYAHDLAWDFRKTPSRNLSNAQCMCLKQYIYSACMHEHSIGTDCVGESHGAT